MSGALLGAFGANHHLRQSLVYLDVPTMPQPEAYISNASSLFDAVRQLAKHETADFLVGFLAKFKLWIDRHKAAAQ